jgi:ribonucleoside-diphosphate reductase alpha chain
MTGLADALAMLGLRYDSEAARHAAAGAMQTIRDAAYRASVELAAERGSFPAYVADTYLERPFIRALPDDIRSGIREHGIRNSHLTALAPAGSISLLAGNVSSGIEPIFQLEGTMGPPGGEARLLPVMDHAWAGWLERRGKAPAPALRHGPDVSAENQLAMQAACRPFVDSAISKTVALPDDFPESGVSASFAGATTASRLHHPPRAGARRWSRNIFDTGDE